MTFRQIEFFTTVCKCKSISKASAVLRISQQGISKALLDLEAELGCQLLKRTSSGVTLTNYGTYVLQEFEIILRKKRVHILLCPPDEIHSQRAASGRYVLWRSLRSAPQLFIRFYNPTSLY